MTSNTKEKRQQAIKSDSPYKLDENYKCIQNDLAPCSMCGAKPYLIFPFRHKKDGKQSKIRCSNCGAYTISDTMYQAIDDWNSQYIINEETEGINIYQYDINYIDDDSIDYFLSHTVRGHQINGDSIYTL